jgi:hypothetical protein
MFGALAKLSHLKPIVLTCRRLFGQPGLGIGAHIPSAATSIFTH